MTDPQWPGQPGSGPQYPQQPPPGAYGAPQPGQPYGAPPGQFGGYPGGPPKAKGKMGLVIGLIAAAVVIAVVAGVLVWKLAGGSSDKPPPKASAKELLVGKSDFPTLKPAGKFTVETGEDDDSDVKVSPSECQELVGKDKSSAETAKAELDNSDAVDSSEETSRDYTVRVTKESKDDDKFEKILDKCSTLTLDTGEVSFDGTIERLDVSGTKVHAEAAHGTFTATVSGDDEDVEVIVALQVIHGVVRGTTVEVTYNQMSLGDDSISSDTIDSDAVELFNKQVEKIQKAD